jgi:DcmR-like sensory protein
MQASQTVDIPIFTDCGLPGVAQIPYGTHMCHFYRDREELVAALVPFFVAGLCNSERCVWITAEPLNSVDARLELEKAGVDVDAAIRSGALTIRDYSEWYTAAETLKSNQVAELWLAEEERALARGYSGLRITGNVSFLTPETWPDFMDYEEVVHQAFQGRRILSLCSYHALRCAPADVLQVVRRHSCALTRPDDGWQVLTGFSN